ncbi:MAG: YbfB/YjiJ family MFS transporter [Clostridia bacterium]
MGIGRFAFTPLLPMMQADAGLSLAQGGWLASANYLGHLAGALGAAALPVRAAPAIRAGTVVIAVATLAMAFTSSLASWIVLRFAAGLAAAWVLVHVSAWALGRLMPLRRPLLNGLVYAGVGFGIALAGAGALLLMAAGSASREAWEVLAVLSIALSLPAWFAIEPGGTRAAGDADGGAAAPSALPTIVCYGIFGFGYIIPATYLPAMARELLGSGPSFGWAWPVFGAAAAASTLAAAPVLARLDNRRVWGASHLVMALGVVAPAVFPGIAGVLASALLVGGTFMVATMTGLQEGRQLAGAAAARLLALMTAAFGIGQVLGPPAFNLLLQQGWRMSGLLWATSALLAASAAYLFLKPLD